MKAAIKGIIANQVGYGEHDIGDITDDATFINLGADSLDVIEMIMEIEDRYNLRLEDSIFEMTNTCTVAEFITHIEQVRSQHEQSKQDAVA